MVRIARQAAHSHVATIAGAVNGNTFPVYPFQRVQIAGGVQTILHITATPVAIIGVLELDAIAGAAAVIGGQHGVAFGQQILNKDVPVVHVLR